MGNVYINVIPQREQFLPNHLITKFASSQTSDFSAGSKSQTQTFRITRILQHE